MRIGLGIKRAWFKWETKDNKKRKERLQKNERVKRKGRISLSLGVISVGVRQKH